MRNTILLLGIILIFCIGCSGVNNETAFPTSPDGDYGRAVTGEHSHLNWGIWQFTADPVAETLDVIQLRTGVMHVNVLPFLDQPPLVYLTLESMEFNGNLIDVEIGLRHPFLGLNEFTGFDVKGIFITNGSLYQ